MFERFSEKAREVVVRSQEAARDLHHGHIGTEHLLLALIEARDSVAYTVLSEAGLTAAGVRKDIKRFFGQDAEALESIGIDLDAVRAKIEESFGAGALDPVGAKPRRGMFASHIPFTMRAKKAIELGLREAIALRHKNIGPEHLLLGLIREGEGLAAKILTDAGFDLAHLRQQLLAAIPKG
jgi:ATP-dependent Clp protease ATP-binding subunit ClpA